MTRTQILALILAILVLACASPRVDVPVPPGDCLVAEDIIAMRAAWNTDSSAVESKYVGEKVCLQSTISDIAESDRYITAVAGIGGAVFSVFRPKVALSPSTDQALLDERVKELKKWLKGKKDGDPIIAECEIEKFIDSERAMYELGTPYFGECELIER